MTDELIKDPSLAPTFARALITETSQRAKNRGFTVKRAAYTHDEVKGVEHVTLTLRLRVPNRNDTMVQRLRSREGSGGLQRGDADVAEGVKPRG